MKQIPGWTFAAVLAVSLCNCSQITLLRVAELQAVQARIDTLAVRLDATQQQLLKEQRQESELLRIIRADMQVRFGELAQRISAIEGNLSENQVRLSDINRATSEMRQRLDEKARHDSLKTSLERAEEENLYQIANSDLAAGRFDIALAGFRDFIARFPSSALVEKATYSIAECHYALKRYDSADVAYKEYLKAYPKGESLCPTLYKMGLVFEKQGKEPHQKKVWQTLLEQCPQSDEARAAASRMPK